MKLEMRKIAGEETPTIIAECMECGEAIDVLERDFMMSRPLHCSRCNHERFLSYREYVVTFDSIAHKLLAFSVSRIDKGDNCLHH
jgi:DNA-directed RNA polymerase subunit RPC12/RpoP